MTPRSAPKPATPPRLARALASLDAWRGRSVHFAPIRHHSPGCSLALKRLLDEVQPAAVLIEGPREYNAVAAALADPRTIPPIAVLSVAEARAGFYPLAEFSPEWVALRWAAEHGAAVEFIDQPYADATEDDDEDDAVLTLQAERHLARSAAIARLAADLGCRDHDEVWEHLFEDRSDAELERWRPFFDDVLAWAGIARLDADRAALDADGTHAREAVMASFLTRHAHSDKGLVVVTGAFHTLALLEVLDETPEASWVLAKAAPERAPDECWLIRYDYTRLDALRGYGAGMPSPGFWQRAWRARLAGSGPRAFTTDAILSVVDALRAGGEPLGTAQAAAAIEQTLRLADLRGRAWPGRADILDGLLSCLAKDDSGLSGALGEAVATAFATSALGDLPDGLASPPLIAQARAEASRLRFDLTTATPKRISLDTARKPRHRARREFCARMRFVGSGFARQIGGADLVAGTGLGQFVEEWEYAWTPPVESALIEASAFGPTLDALLAVRVREHLAAADSAPKLAALLAELVVMGSPEWVPQTVAALDASLGDVARLEDVVAALDKLAGLAEGSGRLDLGDQALAVRGLVKRGIAVVAYLLPGIVGLDRDSAGPAAAALIGLRGLRRRLDSDDAFEAVARELDRLRDDPATPALLQGCLVGIAATDGTLTMPEAAQRTVAHLDVGADAERLADFLVGLMQAAPDVILYSAEALNRVSAAILELSGDDFLTVLPDLRRAFTFLKPTETHRLAEQIARLTGAAASDLDVVLRVDPGLVAEASRLERELVAGLARDGLAAGVAS